MLAVQLAELVAHAHERELGDVGRAARAVAFAKVVAGREGLARAAGDFEVDVRDLSAVSRQRGVDPIQNVVELDLLDVFRRVDAETGDAGASESDQVVGKLLSHRGQSGVQVGER